LRIPKPIVSKSRVSHREPEGLACAAPIPAIPVALAPTAAVAAAIAAPMLLMQTTENPAAQALQALEGASRDFMNLLILKCAYTSCATG
jgi:hypothetical protein